MANYDFSTINPTDFEKLVCDLLNRKARLTSANISFHTFKQGKDRGIDILHSTNENDYEIVVQVKHFINSPYPALKRIILNEEKQKVVALNPKSYVFVTSLPLSVVNKQEIQSIFSPYIKSLDDILGRDDLNDILRDNSDIEERHFKLWFSSTMVLKKIMNYKYVGRSGEYQENILKRKLRLFVNTRELPKAEEILSNKKFLIITGEPGVGKTTLSDILVYKHLYNDFELTVIHDNIYEIEDTIRDDDSKQLFYFDDFLGHTHLQIQKSKTAETFLLKQLARIENSKNKYLILNTRKFILTTLIEESERFRNFMPLRAESRIELSSYSYGAKRRMLDNHILESTLSETLKKVVADCAFKICSHRSFFPRHLEFFTSSLHVDSFTPEQLYTYINENLEDPKNIWDHAYNEQISIYDQLFINTLFSLGGSAYYANLEKAFNSRLDYEVKENNYIKTLDPFKTCLKNLNGGFIDIQLINGNQRVSFINPSLEDYLHHKLSQNSLEIDRILLSASFISQWYHFYPPFKSGKKVFSLNLLNYFKANYWKFRNTIDNDIYLYSVSLFIHYFDSEGKLQLDLIKEVKNWNNVRNSQFIHFHYDFINSLAKHNDFSIIRGYLPSAFFYMTLGLVDNIFEVDNIMRLLWHYDFNFLVKLSTAEANSANYKKSKKIQKYYKELLLREIDFQYDQLLINTEIDAHLDVIERIVATYLILKMYINPKLKIDYSILKDKDWNTIAINNLTDEHIFGERIDYEEYADEYADEYDYDEYDEYDYKNERQQTIEKEIIIDDTHDDLPF